MRVKLTKSGVLSFRINGSVILRDARGNKAQIRNGEFFIKSSGAGSYDYNYYAIVLVTKDRDEAEGLKKDLEREGYNIKIKVVSLGKLKKTYILYTGPYKSKNEIYKKAPPTVIKVMKKSGDNPGVPVFLEYQGRQYVMYGKIKMEVNGSLLLKGVVYSRGLSSEFRKDIIITHTTYILPEKDGSLSVIEVVPIEEYLFSVVKSEIGENAPLEAKKAQAVAARTNVVRKLMLSPGFSDYDITSDVYSQVYQGGGSFSPSIWRAVKETSGEILVYHGEPIEALFHAMCGGHTENSENVWSSYLPYLRGVFDRGKGHKKFSLRNEKVLRKWIESNPDINCKKYGKKYWRWSFIYSPLELGKIVRIRTGKDIGSVLKISVLERGISGRAKKIKITGTKGSIVIRKDLNIRRALSYKSLPSSMFYVEKRNGRFIIKGRGFGHGVGMCQIGAMGMADRGYNYKEILNHYYSHVRLEKIY